MNPLRSSNPRPNPNNRVLPVDQRLIGKGIRAQCVAMSTISQAQSMAARINRQGQPDPSTLIPGTFGVM